MKNGVDTLICGGIGGGAQTALAEAELNSTAEYAEMLTMRSKRSLTEISDITRMFIAATTITNTATVIPAVITGCGNHKCHE